MEHAALSVEGAGDLKLIFENFDSGRKEVNPFECLRVRETKLLVEFMLKYTYVTD